MSTLNELGADIESVMSRYDIPMDDRSFVSDRVYEAIGNMASLSAKVAKTAQDRGDKRVDEIRRVAEAAIGGIKKASQGTVRNLKSKAAKAVKAAYVSGLQGNPNKYSAIHILVVSVVLMVAGILIYREIF